MKVLLVDIDSKIPNLALMKLSRYHKNKGDEVTLIKGNNPSRLLVTYDKTYISCIFEENKKKAEEKAKAIPNSILGGVGTDNNSVKLSEEIEHLMPDYDLYDCDYSFGFTTRGCIRNCYFCKVPKHEGKIKINCDIYEFWDKKHKEIVLLDNNILAVPKHFNKIAKQIKENNLKVDFNQGLDHRLLTPKICKTLLGLKHKAEIRFAFDDIAYKSIVLKALKMLKEAGLKDWGTRWYIYIGENDNFETVYSRMALLRKNKQLVYVMRDKKVYGKKEFVALAKYGNLMGAFKYELKNLTKKSDCLKSYRKVFKQYEKIIEKYDTEELTCFRETKNKTKGLYTTLPYYNQDENNNKKM